MLTPQRIDQIDKPGQKTCWKPFGIAQRRQSEIGAKKEAECIDNGDSFQVKPSLDCGMSGILAYGLLEAYFMVKYYALPTYIYLFNCDRIML